VKQAHAALAKAEPEIQVAQRKWEKQSAAIGPALREGLDFHFAFDGPDSRAVAREADAALSPGVQGTAATLAAKGYFELESIPGLIGNGRFSIAVLDEGRTQWTQGRC
jgi:hypothetical protein